MACAPGGDLRGDLLEMQLHGFAVAGRQHERCVIRRETKQFRGGGWCLGIQEPAVVDPDIAAVRPSELFEPLQECRCAMAVFRIALGPIHRHADPPHSLGLLRSRPERPSRRAAEKRHRLSPPHSITSSARASSEGGTARRSALAVFRFITNSNLVGCCTGRSPSLAPLRMRSTYVALSIDPLQLGKNARSIVQPTSLTRLYASHRDAALHGMHIGCAEGLRFLLSLRRDAGTPQNQEHCRQKNPPHAAAMEDCHDCVPP